MKAAAKRMSEGRRSGGMLTSPEVGDALLANPDLAFCLISVARGNQFRIADANEAFARVVNRPLDTIVDAPLAIGLAGVLTDFLMQGLLKVVETREPVSYHRALEATSGEIIWVTTLTPVHDPDGEIAQIVGLIRKTKLDHTSRPVIEHTETLLETINATLPGLLHMFDLSDRSTRYIGGRWEILGYEAAEMHELSRGGLVALLHPDDVPALERHLNTLADLGEGEADTFECRALHRDGTYRAFLTRSVVYKRDAAGRARLVMGLTVDLSYHKHIEAELDRLTQTLLTMRDDERRRIAGELHDSTAQHIVAAQLALTQIMVTQSKGANRPRPARDPLEEAMEMLKAAEREIRILSFLMHPPSGEVGGQAEALASFARGFGRRAGIEVDVRIDPRLDDVEGQLASDIFRISQEALTNVHRHAAAEKVEVGVEVGEEEIELTVADNGRGMARQDMALGVGLHLISERLERIGGALELHGDSGTRLTARLPRNRGYDWPPQMQLES